MRGEVPDGPAVDRALTCVLTYRATHQYSLTKATMGLRSMVRTERCPIEVSQRLKRITTILDKLKREPTLPLASMQDIGGCRAVFATVGELRRVERRLKKNRPPVRYNDYIERPRASGYRAIHVVVSYPNEAGEQRAIEVQLRTKAMHDWAIAVERLSGRLGSDLKSYRGPAELLEFLTAISEAMALEEAGMTVPLELDRRMAALRAGALPYLSR